MKKVEIENFTFWNADNMEIMKQYPDKYFDLAIVDPPYGLGDSVVNSGGRFKRYENKNGNWDNSIPDKSYFDELFRISKNQIIWGGNYFQLPTNKCFIIWDKLQPEGVSFAMCEYAWCSFDYVAKIHRERTQGQKQRFHPTQKPVDLYDWILKNYAEPNQKILDTHLGSGSIAIAINKANKLDNMNLSFVGIELDEEYFEASMKRFKNHIQQKTIFES